MTEDQAILQILKDVGVYKEARELVPSDAELATMFDQDFGALVSLLTNEKAPGTRGQDV